MHVEQLQKRYNNENVDDEVISHFLVYLKGSFVFHFDNNNGKV